MIKIITTHLFLLFSLVFTMTVNAEKNDSTIQYNYVLFEKPKVIADNCLADECLIVYVSPWCPTCKKIRPTIIALVETLRKEGKSASLIVGKDKANRVTAYAKNFPFPIIEDPTGIYWKEMKMAGVPYFAVINNKGKILKDHFGGYTSVEAFRRKLEI